jgi:hypothetical protein
VRADKVERLAVQDVVELLDAAGDEFDADALGGGIPCARVSKLDGGVNPRHGASETSKLDGLRTLTAPNIEHRQSRSGVVGQLPSHHLLPNRVPQIAKPTDPNLFTRPERCHDPILTQSRVDVGA